MRTGISEPNDGLNEDQLKKGEVVNEASDTKGVVTRQRVTNQTIFDKLMIEFLIEQPQHEAAHMFMEALSKSGGSVRSVNLERVETGPAHKAGDAMVDRRMIFSSAYRFMSDHCEETECKAIMFLCNSPYEYKKDSDSLRSIAILIANPLWALARHYGIHLKRDPRRIIRSQFYFGR